MALPLYSNYYYTDAGSGQNGYFPNIDVNDLTRGDWGTELDSSGYSSPIFNPSETGSNYMWTAGLDGAREKYGSWADSLARFMGSTNYTSDWDANAGTGTIGVKNDDKNRYDMQYTLQDGYYVPTGQGTNVQWDTNNGFQNMALASILAMAGGGALASMYGGAGAGAAGAAGDAAAAGGATAGATASGLPAGFDSLAMLGGTGGATTPLAQGLGTGFAGVGSTTGTLGSILPTGAAVGGLGALGGIGTALDIGGAASSLGGGGSGSTNPIQRLIQAISGGGTDGTGGTQTGSGGTGGVNLSSLMDLLSAWQSRNAMSNYSKDMQNFATSMQNQAQPYMDRLNQSYADPQAYFNSPDVQARLGLESNRLTGIDSQRSRLSNPIERDMLLQKYAAKDIGDYRGGLQNSIKSVYSPESVAKLYGTAFANDAAKNSALVGAGANWLGGGGTGQGDPWGDIGSIIDAGGDIWDTISGWFD